LIRAVKACRTCWSNWRPRATDKGMELSDRALRDFWQMGPAGREAALLEGIATVHRLHYEHNEAYRRTVAARGVGPDAPMGDLSLLLRATANTFKSYVDVLGTPFPEEDAHGFLNWMARQVPVPLTADRIRNLRRSYRSLESLLKATEREFSDLGLRFLTSSGTSGRASIIPRDARSTDLTVEAFYLAFKRYFRMEADHRAVFMMPKRTRIAMACMARFSVQRVGLDPDRVCFAIPFPASPDQVRIRTGRNLRTGWRGALERHAWHPIIDLLERNVVEPLALRTARRAAVRAAEQGEKLLLFGSLAHLHRLGASMREAGVGLVLPVGSLLGSGGGMKEYYSSDPAQIRTELGSVFRLPDGDPVPVRDVYGMAEANWAAMQCSVGNYHVPPWIHCITLDQHDRPQTGAQPEGVLAFFEPYGGGVLFPGFFKTADRVVLATGERGVECSCGETGAYLARDSIQRVDLIGESGCAAQL